MDPLGELLTLLSKCVRPNVTLDVCLEPVPEILGELPAASAGTSRATNSTRTFIPSPDGNLQRWGAAARPSRY